MYRPSADRIPDMSNDAPQQESPQLPDCIEMGREACPKCGMPLPSAVAGLRTCPNCFITVTEKGKIYVP